MQLYICLFILTLTVGIIMHYKQKSNLNKIYSFLLLITLSIIVSIRSIDVGADTLNYIKLFNQINFANFNNHDYDIGFKIYTLVIRLFTSNFRIYFFITSLLTFYGFIKFIKENSFIPWISVVVFLAMFFLPSMNLIRQWLAMSLSINSYSLIKRNQNIKGILIILLASTIHLTAIFLIVIPIVNYFRKSSPNLILSLALL